MRITFENGSFIAFCRFEQREKLRAAGFRFDGDTRRWQTEKVTVAARLRDYADGLAKKEINRLALKFSPWTEPLPYPKELTPHAFQLDPSALFSLSRNRSYLGLDPGLGKTPIAAIVANALCAPTVVIGPPFLARNLEIEFAKWSTWRPNICRFDARVSKVDRRDATGADILVVPDTFVHRPAARSAIAAQAAWAELLGLEPLLIVDEAHRYKTEDTRRTQALFSLARLFPRQVYLSGTPMPNRPMELYPVLSHCAPETIDCMTREEFGLRYCAGVLKEEECPKCHGRKGKSECRYCRGRGGFQHGYDFSGASNLAELKRRIKPFMLRIRKADVRKDMPASTEEAVLLGPLPPKLMSLDQAIASKHSIEDLIQGKLKVDNLGAYRRLLGKYKLKSALDFIKSLLEDREESLLVFAYHREVMAGLAIGLAKYKPFVVTGDTPHSTRHDFVQRFQKGESRVFAGNYIACGVGLTLTRAKIVVFVEQSWVDDENKQASERTAQRIGQLNDVHTYYLVYENSLDMKVLRANSRKRKITSQL